MSREEAATDFALLPAVEIETSAAPDATVVFLHGLGDDGHGWSDVVPALRLPTTLHVRFIFPHAPEIPVTLNGGYVMPAWYDLYDTAFDKRADMAGMRTSRTRIERLIARERERGIAARRIVVGGFSQGGATALFTALRHGERLAGVAALSAYVVDPEVVDAEAAPANRGMPVFMAHGTEDDVVRFAWGEASRRVLVAGGWPVEWRASPIGHSAVLEEMEDLGRFIVRVLAS
jgi:phospholipase/carboxylesterase